MSRGFVKEDDQEEIPFVPPRADLPDGVTNYVTQVGMNELLVERQALIDEKLNVDATNENERRIALNHIDAKLVLLNNRISTAKLVDLSKQRPNEVRFGALVTLKISTETKPKQYQIVGVDEADVFKGKISFISPLARTLINKTIGEKAILKLPKADKHFEILAISY